MFSVCLNMNANNKSNNNIDKGHRERLRKYIIQNYDTATKEKILEYFLCLSIPRRDTRILAKVIFDKTNQSFVKLLNGDYNYLKNYLTLSDAVIAEIFTFRKIMSFTNEEMLAEDLNIKKLDSRKKIAKYLQNEIGSKDTEYILVLFLSPYQTLIEKKIFGDKNNSFITFDVGNIINTALNNNAKYIVLSHNHPSNDVMPSQEDIIATTKFETAIKTINKFDLIDHIIVGSDKYFSFYDNNLLSNNFNINKKISNNNLRKKNEKNK